MDADDITDTVPVPDERIQAALFSPLDHAANQAKRHVDCGVHDARQDGGDEDEQQNRAPDQRRYSCIWTPRAFRIDRASLP